jgi:HEAT repeat protein
LNKLLFSQDVETVTDACWALSYISDGPNDRIQAVLDAGVAPRLVQLLGSNSPAVQTPALRTVGNIVTGDDNQTQQIINLNALPAFVYMLDNPKKNIRKEACWTISNITAGTSDQIQAVINADVFPKLIHLLASSEFDIQKEAAWAVSNATSGGTPQQILYLVHQNCIPPLCNLLSQKDLKVIKVALEGLENILRVAKAQNETLLEKITEAISNCGGEAAIEDLQNHQQQSIYERAVNMLETYFGMDEEENGEIVPDIQHGQYTFGAQGGAMGGDFSF